MKTIEITLKGVGEGLLMNSTKSMALEIKGKSKAKKYDHKIDAESVSYRNSKNQLIVPSRCLKACILNAASWYKFGKLSAKQLIAGCTTLEPTEIILTDKNKALTKYEVDIRPVVIQRARIMRARPLIRSWQLNFKMVYDEKMITSKDDLYKIIKEAGQRIGLLDNRPQKFGENGKFEVVKFK